MTISQYHMCVMGVSKVLKAKFPNLTVEETLKLAGDLLQVVVEVLP